MRYSTKKLAECIDTVAGSYYHKLHENSSSRVAHMASFHTEENSIVLGNRNLRSDFHEKVSAR